PGAGRRTHSFSPPMPLVSVTVTEAPDPTVVASTASTGGGSTTTGSVADSPPPGGGVHTETVDVPAEMSAVGISACSFVELTTVVATASPFPRTVDNALKSAPVMVSRAAAPARMRDGETSVIDGVGLVTDVRVASA